MTVKTYCPYCDNRNLFYIPTIQEAINDAENALKENPREEWALDMLKDLEKEQDKTALDDSYALNTPIFCKCGEHYFYNYKTDEYDYVKNEFTLQTIIEKLNKPCEPNSNPSYIYFLKNVNNGLVKIGFSQNIKTRQSTLKTAGCFTELICKFKTVVDKQFFYENIFHCIFQKWKIFREWYNIPPEILEKLVKRESLIQSMVAEGKSYNEVKSFILNNLSA